MTTTVLTYCLLTPALLMLLYVLYSVLDMLIESIFDEDISELLTACVDAHKNRVSQRTAQQAAFAAWLTARTEHAREQTYIEPHDDQDPDDHILWDLSECLTTADSNVGVISVSNNSAMLVHFNPDCPSVTLEPC